MENTITLDVPEKKLMKDNAHKLLFLIGSVCKILMVFKRSKNRDLQHVVKEEKAITWFPEVLKTINLGWLKIQTDNL
jgi:hypothetical protein